jgi:hypothetical protein
MKLFKWTNIEAVSSWVIRNPDWIIECDEASLVNEVFIQVGKIDLIRNGFFL